MSSAQTLSILTEQDALRLRALLPATALSLVEVLGAGPALVLMNTWPGVELKVPKSPKTSELGARRWAQITALIGEAATARLAEVYGGAAVPIPTCRRAREEKRNRAIRGDFDRFTARAPAGMGLTRDEAIQEVGMRYAPISSRQLESILNRAS